MDERVIVDQETETILTGSVANTNVFYLRAEGRTYNFARSLNRDPTFMVSGDDASTWAYGGKLLTDKRIGYVNAYVKYASNGEDRIDFIATEHHPRDFSNSIYHGYIQGGKTHRSDGKVVDDSIFNSVAAETGCPDEGVCNGHPAEWRGDYALLDNRSGRLS